MQKIFRRRVSFSFILLILRRGIDSPAFLFYTTGMGYKDETNKVYGRLTVLREDGHFNREKAWLCQCSCHKVVRIRGSSLRNGTVRSCGCYRTELVVKRSKNELNGKRFGNLIVLEQDRESIKEVRWVVQCDCGAVFSIRGSHLTASGVRNCVTCGHTRMGLKRRTHGKSRTQEYRRYIQRIRDERKELLDSAWTFEMENALFSYFSNQCVVCYSSDKLHVDHVYPLSKGHGLVPGNVVLLCRHHNEKKNYLTPEQLIPEWRDKILSAAEDFKLAWESGFRG